MIERMSSSVGLRVLACILVLAVVTASTWWFLEERNTWPRGEALGDALRPVVEGKNSEQALVARAIWDNYLETRSNASRWSGVYWGFTFTAAVFSALAALCLADHVIEKVFERNHGRHPRRAGQGGKWQCEERCDRG